jgi:hypothetical protein
MKTGFCLTTIALFALLTCPANASFCAGCDDECGMCEPRCSTVNWACVYHGQCIPQTCGSGELPAYACICCDPNECSIPGSGCVACPEGQLCDATGQCYTPGTGA